MRILILPSWYPTQSKPVNGIFIREQADALGQEHDVHVLYLDVLPRGYHERATRRLSRMRGYIEEVIEVPNRPVVWQFTYLAYMARALRRVSRRFKPDIVHAHIAVPAGWGAVLLKRITQAPIVLTENSSEFNSWTRRRGLRWMARRAMSDADCVIAVSEGQRRRIEDTFPGVRRLEVIPNIVDTSRFAPAPIPEVASGYRLIFVGLLDTDQKGLHILLEALSVLRQSGIGLVHVDIIGDGKLRPRYQEQARTLLLQERVTFHGLQDHETIARMMRRSHALVLPSLHEAAPLVLIEALASGRPAVVTRCGGPEYMINEDNGLSVEPSNVQQLADAIRHLLVRLESYDSSRISQAAVGLYSYSAIVTRLTSVYKSLVFG